MKVDGREYRSIWPDESDPSVINVVDQRRLPFVFEIKQLRTVDDVYSAICDMTLRGAPVIGAAGAFGMYLATIEITRSTDVASHLDNAAKYLVSSRPTAVNLPLAVSYVRSRLDPLAPHDRLTESAFAAAMDIYSNELESCMAIGRHGLGIIEEAAGKNKGRAVNILTHCNAGWLACIDYGTVTSPVYLAAQKGIPLHIWVDETRPRNQGARLTAWELGNENIPHTLITDNAGGYLMQKGMVDLVITGSDRTTACGDVANKTGTYLKALAAHDNNIPFYVALPSSSIDFTIRSGPDEIEIEERDQSEVTMVEGYADGEIVGVRICPEKTTALNYGFDITPARLITALITERGICRADEKEIKKMFPEKFN